MDLPRYVPLSSEVSISPERSYHVGIEDCGKRPWKKLWAKVLEDLSKGNDPVYSDIAFIMTIVSKWKRGTEGYFDTAVITSYMGCPFS
jgi:hypothetical protein